MTASSGASTIPEYIAALEEPRRGEVKRLHDLIRKTAPHQKPYMGWGMICYGKFHYRYETGREGDWCVIALSSRKNYISVYVCATRDGRYVAEASKHLLPRADIGKSCIRFKRIEDVDLDALARVIREGVKAKPAM